MSIVCQINILAGVQTLVWQNQAKAWTPFSESLYNYQTQVNIMMKQMTLFTQRQNFSTHQTKDIFIMKRSTSLTQWQNFSTISLLVAMLLMIVAPPSLVQAAAPVAGFDFGTALDFDGTDDRIDIGTLNGEMLGSSSRTIEAWVKTTSTAEGTIFKYGKDVAKRKINIRTGDGEIQIDAQGSVTKWEAPTVNDGNWHHVAWSYSSGTNLGDGIVYVDGMALTTLISNTGTKPPDTQTGEAYIGSRDNQFYFEGSLDEVRVWNVARSQTEIQDNMYSPLTGAESGLVGYWSFEEGSGTTASDNTTNGNDGTLTNMDAADWLDSTALSWTTNENSPLSDILPAYDRDGDALTYTLVNDDGGAAVITDTSTGAFTYTPATSGTRTFTYKVKDDSVDSNIATVTVTVVPAVANIIITAITATASDGAYNIGDTIDITIQFDEVVTVTGTPQLTLETGTTDAVVDYTSGSGTDILTFTYTVASDHTNTDLDYVSTTALSLNGGTIQDAATNDADLTLPIPGTAGSLGANKDLIIDTTLPNVPTDLTTNPVSQTQIDLSWTDNSTDEIGFKIERADSLIITTAADATSYSDSDLSCGTTYSYSVKATNASDDSTAVTASATTLACSTPVPNAPTTYKLLVSKTGNGTISSIGISCGSDCQEYLLQGTNATLTATSDDGWLFNAWGGDCEGTEPTITITLDANKTCTPLFEEITCPTTNRLHINKTASGKGIGCDWENAFTDLQKALAEVAAGTFSGVNEIWVAKGTYKPTNSTNRSATFQLINGVSIYGGFSGIETQLSERNSSANATILSGDIGIAGDNSDNSYHVVTGSGTNNTAILNGFIISGGNANDGEICPNACGGGLFNDNGSPTLKHLFIRGNTAIFGGGVMNWHESQPVIKETFISENSATDGGGIMNDGSHPVISHVFVKDNTAINTAGGLLNRNNANPLLSQVNLNNNTATTGGGMVNDNSNPVVSHSILTANMATDGAGMANQNLSAPLISHVIISGNTANQSGGAILNDNSTPLITQSTLSGNSSGIVNRNSRPTVNNSILWNNSIAITDDANSQTTVNYSIVEGGWAGNGNKADDPLFIEVADATATHSTVGAFNLTADSPAIDAGNNDLIPLDLADAECFGGDGNTTSPVDFDFDGRERRFDGNGDGVDVVDMGAYEAFPSLSFYPLTVTITGSGTINSNKVGITCGTDCNQDYLSGTEVLLIAKANIGSQFVSWNGACSGNKDHVLVEMTEAKSCEAQFDRIRVSLDGITLICEDCTINNATLETVEAQSVDPDNYVFPQSLVAFELSDIVNPQTHIAIYYHNINNLDNFIYRKYGPTTPGEPNNANWYNLSNVTIGLDTLDGKIMLKASLTLADGALGDNTGVDGRIVIGASGIAIEIKPPPIPSTLNAANTNNFGGQAITDDMNIEENRSISNVVFEGDVVENKGLISNSTISANTTLTGGKLTGTITNEGTIADIYFVGIKLEGGTLSGNIVNNSKVGGIIKNVELTEGAVLKGGKVGGEITGDPNDPPLITAAQIMPGSILSNVRISPTVELPKYLVLGDGVILPSEPPTLADFGLEPEDIAQLDANTLADLEPAVFSTLTAEEMAQIPPAAFAVLEAAQMAEVKKSTLEGMTTEQFEQLPVDTLGGLTSENMGGLPTAVLNQLMPKHLNALDIKEFQAMSSEDISKLFINLDANKITPQDVEKLVPKTWELDLKTGALTLPFGTKATLQNLPLQLPSHVTLPTVSNLGAGFGIGGGGAPLIEETQRSLAGENLENFVLSQDENGILRVEGTGEAKGVLYTFIPDAENAIIVDTDKMPIGLSVGAGGFYRITIPNGLQFKVFPAPKDPVALSQSLGGGEVIIGKRGDVMVELSNKTRRRGARQVVIMDPFIEPTPDELLCREIIPGVVICDFDVMSPSKRSLRDKSDTSKIYKVVYPDNTAQTVRPTLLSPDVFIEEALKFKGVQQIVYNANGTFHVLYRGKIYTIVPNFNITSREATTDEKIDPSIVLNDNGTLTYTIAIDVVEEVEVEEEKNRRFGRRGRARSVLIFDPFIEPAPEDLLCREIFPGKTICDFEIKDALIR